METLDAYVVKADGKQVRIKVFCKDLNSKLQLLGFTFDTDLSSYIKETTGMADKAQLFSQLRDLGVCFSAGREWCPSELFEYFREQKLVSGKYRRIAWTEPNKYSIQEL